ncbi:MAG: hypothetical protein CML67_16950 [Rhodobacteraceae bacterium]|nr:hypothetical protein [Paracoccaceae bacterium]
MSAIEHENIHATGRILDRFFTVNWVFSAPRDLVFLIGSVLAGWAVFGIYLLLGWNMILVWLIWVIVLDTPHFFATYSRTYLDRQARQEMRPLLIASLGVFLVGPLALVLSYGLNAVGASFYMIPWSLFLIGVSLWAYWHITRQHYGILRLYHRKNGEWGTLDARIDAWVLYGCLLIPFLALIARHPSARGRVGLPEAVPWLPGLAEGQSVVSYLVALRWEHMIVLATLVCVAVLLTVFVARQVYRIANGERIALPKLLFLSAVLPLHLYMCYSDYMLATGLLTFTVIVTIYHDIQYLAIVWFYNQNRYGQEAPEASKRTFGLAAVLSRNFLLYLGFAIVAVSLPVWGLGCLINRIPVCASGPAWGTETILDTTTWIAFYVILTSGFQMHHYLLDQYIWRPGKDRRLREDLKIEETGAPA